MDGVSFRKLADQNRISPAQVWRKVVKEMDSLPQNAYISAKFCERWSGRLNLDGKYVKVKGYDQKIPFIYGIDFLTHDIPAGVLAPSENEEIFLKLFRTLKACKYPLQIVISDEAAGLREALKVVYPKARIQLCQNHYLENIRNYLTVRTQDTYQAFFYEFHQVFNPKIHPAKRDAMLRRLYYVYAQKEKNEVIQTILADVARRNRELFAYTYHINKCPNTNNIIECFNSHLNGRLKTIKGFQSFHSAERWLNAWMIRRRTKAFTDCEMPFKDLNGKCSLELVIKKGLKPPYILGIKHPN